MFDKEKMAQGIKAARLNAKMSQIKVAEGIGVTKASVSRWETGERLPAVDKLWELADYFGISLDQLSGRDSSK